MRDFEVGTVPNQTVVMVHRDMPNKNEGNFIMVKKENLARAYRDLNATGTMLYLFFVGNANGYSLAFSPQAVNNAIGMPLSTARDQRKLLIEKGYLVPRKEGGNMYDFYEIPQPPKEEDTAETRTASTSTAQERMEFVF